MNMPINKFGRFVVDVYVPWPLFAAILFFFLSGSVLGSTIRDVGTTDAGYQTLASFAQFQSVGLLTSGVGNCSGTLITGFHVLTAAHCIGSSLNFNIGGNSYGASSSNIFGNTWSGNTLAGTDIAVIRLSAYVPGIIPANLYTGTDEIGMLGFSVGFGRTGTGLTGDTLASGTKRAFDNAIDGTLATIARAGDTINSANILVADFDNPVNTAESSMGTNTAFNFEGNVAPGDSGGGLFVEVDSSWFLAGVTTFRDANCFYDNTSTDCTFDSDYGDISGWTRVSSFGTFIAAAVVPIPPAIWLFTSGLLGLIGIAKKRK